MVRLVGLSQLLRAIVDSKWTGIVERKLVRRNCDEMLNGLPTIMTPWHSRSVSYPEGERKYGEKSKEPTQQTDADFKD